MMLYSVRLLTCDKEAITIRVDMDGTCWIGDTNESIWYSQKSIYTLYQTSQLTYTSTSASRPRVMAPVLQDHFSPVTASGCLYH